MTLKSSKLAIIALVCATLSIIATGPVDAGARKDRAIMKDAAVDVVAVCINLVARNQPLDNAISNRGFKVSRSNKIGQKSFKVVYYKIYGRGLFKTVLEIAAPSQKECVTKVGNNYESEALWEGVDAVLKTAGLKATKKPIIASGMYIAGYKLGSRAIAAYGNAGSAEAITIISRK